jgi:hypothetical protein
MGRDTFDELLDAIEELPIDEQADLIETARRRLAERGRRRVIDDIAEARAEFAAGAAKPASVDEIMRDIES